MNSPIDKTYEDLKDILAKISSKDSPVGIDAKLTHAVIIDYLQTIDQRLSRIESKLD